LSTQPDNERVMMSIPSLISFVNEARNVASQRDVDPFITSTSGPFSPPGVTHAISVKPPVPLPSQVIRTSWRLVASTVRCLVIRYRIARPSSPTR
jgi:hypothetical protein